MSQSSIPTLGRVASTVVMAWLTACGGQPGPTDAAVARAEVAQPTAIVAPLLADDGSFYGSDTQAQPADAAAWTRQGRYATAEQAGQLERAFGDNALRIEVGCCGTAAVEVALGTVWGLQAAHDLPMDAPVLVHGRDLRLVAAAVNGLVDGGMTRVWMVTR